MAMTNAEGSKIAAVLGVMLQPGLAMGYPDLVRLLGRLYADRVARLPWVPSSWLGAVQALQAKYPADLVRLAPARDPLGRRGQMAPSFADTDAKLDAWHAIWRAQQDAVTAYAKRQSDDGAARLRALEADAAFWDGAYKLAVTVRDLPSGVVKAAGRGVSDFVGTFLPDGLKGYAKAITWALALLIVGWVIMWYRKKLGGIVQGFRKGAA